MILCYHCNKEIKKDEEKKGEESIIYDIKINEITLGLHDKCLKEIVK